MGFSKKVRNKVLLWSDRHCCICKKNCGTNIEVHHIVPKNEGGKDTLDNATPLCFDCHGQVESYNSKHPRGNKYKGEELKSRREQIYEESTRHLVPLIHYGITQDIPGKNAKRVFPDVGFILSHRGNPIPIQVKVKLDVLYKGKQIKSPKGHYSGKNLWRLNPGFTHSGHFKLAMTQKPQRDKLLINVNISIIDQYGREHEWLPVGYYYKPNDNCWFFNP